MLIGLDLEMVDDLHHGGEVALLLKITWIDADQAEKFICIDEVKIAGQGQIPGWHCITFYKRVTKFSTVLALGTITQVTQQDFPQKRDMSFHEARMFGDIA